MKNYPIDFSKVKILSPEEKVAQEETLRKALSQHLLKNLQEAGFSGMTEKNLTISRDRIAFKTPTVRKTILDNVKESVHHLDIIAEGTLDLATHSTSEGFLKLNLLAITGPEEENYHEVRFPLRKITGICIDITKEKHQVFQRIQTILKTAEKGNFELLVKTMNDMEKGYPVQQAPKEEFPTLE